MDTASTTESMREEQDFIRRLHSVVHSLSCDDPDCPWADVFNESLNVDASSHQDALLLVLIGIVDNIGECLELIRTLLARRNDTSRLGHSTQPTTNRDPVSSGTTSHSQREGTTTGAHGPLRGPPTPSLYHDQWARSPAVSPPAYTAFWHSRPRGVPRAPAPSPASRGSETIPSTTGAPIPKDQEGAGCGSQDGQHQNGTPIGPFISALGAPGLSAGTSCRICSPAGGNDGDDQPRGRFAAPVDSDTEPVDWLGSELDSS